MNNNNFSEISKQIANDFLQSIVFIDDKAFINSEHRGNHDFDAYSVSKIFAEKNKICAIYKPKTAADIVSLSCIATKADITILDWQIFLDGEAVPQGREEDDEDVVDPRGSHTMSIIKSILSDNVNQEGSLKLIIVYTGETDLEGIAARIFNELTAANVSNLQREFCAIFKPNIKILVLAKPDNEVDEGGQMRSKFQHLPQYNVLVKTYEQLPDLILYEFSKMTSGLLSNFVLRSLTILRNNTFKFVKLYNKELDIAFLIHRLLLANQDDSKEQLIEIFADSVEALLSYNQVDEILSATNINHWVDTKAFSKNITISNRNITINNAFIKTWIRNNFVTAALEQWATLNYPAAAEDTSKDISRAREKLFQKPSTLLSDVADDSRNIEFSVLTHHKSIFKPSNIVPKLTLGALVKGEKSGYWVCIQQRCDSIRLDGERRFLFLPLKEDQEKFHFVTADGIRLKLSKKSFDLRTIKFIATNEDGVVKATVINDKYYFIPKYAEGHNAYLPDVDERFEWLLDLKSLHAQRIAHDFASELSRVGLDESEWLRRR